MIAAKMIFMMINFEGELMGVNAARKLFIYMVSFVFVVLYIIVSVYSIWICSVFMADITVANGNNKKLLTLVDYLTLLSDWLEE